MIIETGDEIITDRKQLSKPCEPVKDMEEGREICNHLRRVLSNRPDAMGLAANQIDMKEYEIKVEDLLKA